MLKIGNVVKIVPCDLMDDKEDIVKYLYLKGVIREIDTDVTAFPYEVHFPNDFHYFNENELEFISNE